MKKGNDNLNCIILDIDFIKKNRTKIMEYIKIVLFQNNLNDSIEEITRIYNNMIKFSKDGTAIIVGAIEDTKLFGFIWAYEVEINEQKRLHITQFVVDEQKRGKGIGKKLIENIYDIAKERKIEYIELMATYDNKKTIEFYEKQKFIIERVKMCKKIL